MRYFYNKGVNVIFSIKNERIDTITSTKTDTYIDLKSKKGPKESTWIGKVGVVNEIDFEEMITLTLCGVSIKKIK